MKFKSNSKSLSEFLLNKYGISNYQCMELCKELGFLPTVPFNELSSENLLIVEMYSDIFKIERSTRINNIAKKVKLGTIQGIRMRLGRPVRGQRTHTNSNTAAKLNKGRIKITQGT